MDSITQTPCSVSADLISHDNEVSQRNEICDRITNPDEDDFLMEVSGVLSFGSNEHDELVELVMALDDKPQDGKHQQKIIELLKRVSASCRESAIEKTIENQEWPQ